MKTLPLLICGTVVAFALGLLSGLAVNEVPDKEEGPGPHNTRFAARGISDGSEDSRESIEEVLQALKAGAVPKGAGPISGHVYTNDGTPMEGVEVSAEILLPASPAKREPSLEDEVQHVTDMRRLRQAFDRKVLTNAEGEFVFDGMPPLAFELTARKAGFRFEVSWHAHHARPGYRLNFTSTPTVSLNVSVAVDDGALPADITIEYSFQQKNRSGQLDAKWWPGCPPLELDPAEYKMSAVSGVNKELRSEEKSFTLVLGSEPPQVNLKLRPQPGIRGRVIVNDDFSEREFDVTCIRYEGEPPADGRVSGKDDFVDRQRDVAQEENGFSYKLIGLPPGKYALFLVDGRRTVARELVVLLDAMVERDLSAPAPVREDYIVVKVLTPEGKPAKCRSVSQGFPRGGTFSTGTVIRAKDGSYWVPKITDEDISSTGKSSLVITAYSEKFGKRSEPYKHGETTELTIRFEATDK